MPQSEIKSVIEKYQAIFSAYGKILRDNLDLSLVIDRLLIDTEALPAIVSRALKQVSSAQDERNKLAAKSLRICLNDSKATRQHLERLKRELLAHRQEIQRHMIIHSEDQAKLGYLFDQKSRQIKVDMKQGHKELSHMRMHLNDAKHQHNQHHQLVRATEEDLARLSGELQKILEQHQDSLQKEERDEFDYFGRKFELEFILCTHVSESLREVIESLNSLPLVLPLEAQIEQQFSAALNQPELAIANENISRQ